MKAVNFALAAWAIAATAVNLMNCNTQPCLNEQETDVTEIIVPEGKSIDVVAKNVNGLLKYTVRLTEGYKNRDWSKYDGLKVTSHKNIVSITESICTDFPELNDFFMTVSVPNEGNVEMPITWGLHEMLKAAYKDDFEITFTLSYLEEQDCITWYADENDEGVYPDYPETFWEWNL